MLEAARMAELTAPSAAQTDVVVSAQLAEVRDEIKEMNKKWQQLTVQPLKLDDDEVPQRTSKPQTVTRGGSGQLNYHCQQQRVARYRPPMQPWMSAATAPQWNAQPRQWPRQTGYNNNNIVRQSMCRNCGWQSHDYPRQCPAVNQYCRLCSRIGHFGRCCFSAAKAMQMQEQAQSRPGNYSQ